MTFNAGIEAAALKWPNGCHDPDSCARHKRCMYVQCRNLNRDIKDEIGEAVAEQNTRPSSSAPVEQREAVARIIDPQAFKMWHDLYHHCIKNGDDEAFAKRCADSSHKPDCDAALTKADAILSLPRSSRDEVLDHVVKFDECETPEPTLRTMILAYYIQGLQPDAKLAKEYADRFIRALKSGGAK